LAAQAIDSSGENYANTWSASRAHDSSQVTWTNNHLSLLYSKIESETSVTAGIPATYNHAYPPSQLRDLLLPSRADILTTRSESETAASSEIPLTYNHASSAYNHSQLHGLLLTSRGTSSSAAQDESETSSEIPPVTSRDDVTAVTSHPAMGVANLRVKLCNAKLWRQFHACTNEMIITKAGRQAPYLFVCRAVRIEGLLFEYSVEYRIDYPILNDTMSSYLLQGGYQQVFGRMVNPLPFFSIL